MQVGLGNVAILAKRTIVAVAFSFTIGMTPSEGGRGGGGEGGVVSGVLSGEGL
jgi:hypothetical protein